MELLVQQGKVLYVGNLLGQAQAAAQSRPGLCPEYYTT